MSVFFIEYIIASLVFAALDVLLAVMSFRKRGVLGKALGATCVGCALVDLSYLVSVCVENAFLYSCMSSLYFVSVDLMLMSLVIFVLNFCKFKITKMGNIHFAVASIYVGIEIVLFAVNPFKDFVISYIPRATEFAKYSYDMHIPYYAHLVFCYMLVATVVFFLVLRLIQVPWEYKRQYLYAILGVVGIVGVNAIFLFTPGLSAYNFLDYSILGYSLGAYVFYWACFQYSVKGMMNLLKMSVFENIDQGLVLFDYTDKLILFNDMARRQWANVQFKDLMHMDEFATKCKIEIPKGHDAYVLQCYVESDGENKPLRCDFRTLRNKKGRILGRLFMFSNAMLATDPLTGFHNWEDFKFYVNENKSVHRSNVVVGACDIIGLSALNGTQGRHVGDQKIKQLADLFRKHFPTESYFVRGMDATFIVLHFVQDPQLTVSCLKAVAKDFDMSVQYSHMPVLPEDDMLDAIDDAVRGLRQKRLLNKESSHSVILNSLVQALRECDSDTEEHVRRTQMMGAELGRRIGLNDTQQSELSLLCLLHDIGKIGVPLEILNKPGKLTSEEWRVLRSHATKGYQIANSSSELRGIADMILHHHERWDGAGYPDGLSRESIPLLSRVISVVDAYDAMVNNRSYRAALPKEKALDELRRCAGSQFDPGIVSEFIQMAESLPSSSAEVALDETLTSETEAIVREELEQSPVDQSIHYVHNLLFSRYIVDDQFNIVSVDRNFEDLTGYTQEEVTNNCMNHLDLIPPEDRTEYLCMVNEKLAKSPQAFFEHRLVRKDGNVSYVFCFGRQYFDSAVRASRSEIIVVNAADTYSLRVIADVERNRARNRETEWENAYRKDSLTGVLTRAAFKNDTEFKLLEGEYKVMLLMLDVDHFKEYNDTYGHKGGDEFLTLVGQTIMSSLRHGDIAGRMGGDEFAAALFFKKSCSDEFMYERAQQIFDKINMTLKMNSAATSLSMGAVVSNEKLDNFNSLYESADKRLYRSKESGRSRLSVTD